MNYLTFQRLLARLAKKSAQTADFHQAFVEAIQQNISELEQRVTGFDQGHEAGELRPAEQAKLVNQLLKVVGQKASIPDLPEKDVALCREYGKLCYLALIEPKVKEAIQTDFEQTMVLDIAQWAQEVPSEDPAISIPNALGLRLDTLKSFQELTAHFAYHRKLLLEAYEKAERDRDEAECKRCVKLLQQLNGLEYHLAMKALPLAERVSHDESVSNWAYSALYGFYLKVNKGINRGANSEIQSIINRALPSLYFNPKQDNQTANKIYACLLSAIQTIQFRLMQNIQMLQEANQARDEDAIQQAQAELEKNQAVANDLTTFVQKLEQFPGRQFQQGLQFLKFRHALSMQIEQALADIGNDRDLSALRAILLQARTALVSSDEDGQFEKTHRRLIKKLLKAILSYEKSHSAFFKNPFSNSRKALDILSENLKVLAGQSPSFKVLYEEVYGRESMQLGLATKDKIESGYRITMSQQIAQGLLSLNQTMATKYMSKANQKHHLGRAEQLKKDIETLVSATQMAHLPDHLKAIMALTHYGEQSGDTVTEKMREEAIFRLLLKELREVSYFKGMDGKYVSHNKTYANLLRDILIKTKNSQDKQMQALSLVTDFALNALSFRMRDKKNSAKQNHWADYIRDRLEQISLRLGQKIPEDLRDQYPGKIYYDGETVIKDYAKFLFEEERYLSLHEENFSGLKKLIKVTFDKIKNALPQEYQDYLKILYKDTKEAKKAGETVGLATIGERIHYISRTS